MYLPKTRIALAITALYSPLSTVSAMADDATKPATLKAVNVSAAQVYAGAPNDVAHTASKTDTPLRDIPASVAVISAEALHDQGAVTMNDAMRNVSSVQPLMAGGYGFANSYTSRGLPLSFLRDSMPDGSAQNSYFRTMYDVERIEVLKGPGSALFGVANPGGSINVITKKPQEEFALEGGITAGSFGTSNGYVDATGKIGDGVSGRIIADVEKTDGYRDLGRDIQEISPSVLWAISDQQSLLVDVSHRDQEIIPDNYGILFDKQGKLADVSPETRYYSPFNTSDQTIDRLGVTHNIQFSSMFSLRSALTHDQRELYILRNAGGSPGTLTNSSTGRNVRQQKDDASYDALQNELTIKAGSGFVKQTILC